MRYYDTLIPYDEIEYKGIKYSNCVDFDHISRYRCLRTVSHTYSEDGSDKVYVTLETPNSIHANIEVRYYTVRQSEENRLDLIADKYMGSAQYSWILAYINGIRDGFTVSEGDVIMIPSARSVTPLFDTGEMLASVNATLLNLGEE